MDANKNSFPAEESSVENSVGLQECELSASNETISPLSFNDIVIKKLDENDVDEAETVDITPEKSGGVLKKIVQEGVGNEYPNFGDRVSVHYTGWLLVKEPKIFDTTRKDGKSVDFNIGRGMVIKGWDLGIGTMKRGEIALFICHPTYAYGTSGYLPAIPPNTPLLFEVELLDWKLEDLSPKKDNSILRKILVRGEGNVLPNEGSHMKVKLIFFDEDTLFEDIKEFILGEGCNSNIPEGIEIALQKFRLKEKSEIFLKNKCVSGEISELSSDFKSEIKYEVTLLNFEKVKDIWEMNSDEKFERAKVAKEKGISFFQAGKYKVALKQFKLIVGCLEKEPGVSPDSQDSRMLLLLSGYLNISLCYLKLENFLDAIKVCDKALAIDPKNEKALFRRGQAKVEVNDCEEAINDFEALLKINPDNKAALKHLILCQHKMKTQKFKDKSTYNKMFEIFKERDEERLRNMKTETGVWENEEKDDDEIICNVDDLISINSSALLDANVIEISNTLNENLYII